MNKLQQTLQGINWDFSDYKSSKNPLDINSVPWYPATFISPIPKYLIGLLTRPGDTVLDPFGGKGTTTVEAVKQGRYSIYNDLNPFAAEITNSIIHAIQACSKDAHPLDNEERRLTEYQNLEVESFAKQHGMKDDVSKWYDEKTLKELFAIINLMLGERQVSQEIFYLRKLAFTSILKFACSQPGHFTYITDNCIPKKLVYKNATKLYLDKAKQTVLAAQDLLRQFTFTNPDMKIEKVLENTRVVSGDARNMNWISNSSVNLVLTSPPYLCAQDYIKTMRLFNLFFPNDNGFEKMPQLEIGPRRKRRSKADVVSEFYSDMGLAFSEIERVLVPNGYFCLVIGQGKAKVIQGYDTISDLCKCVKEVYHMTEIYHVQRRISNRDIQVGGVDKEDIVIFQKNG